MDKKVRIRANLFEFKEKKTRIYAYFLIMAKNSKETRVEVVVYFPYALYTMCIHNA